MWAQAGRAGHPFIDDSRWHCWDKHQLKIEIMGDIVGDQFSSPQSCPILAININSYHRVRFFGDENPYAQAILVVTDSGIGQTSSNEMGKWRFPPRCLIISQVQRWGNFGLVPGSWEHRSVFRVHPYPVAYHYIFSHWKGHLYNGVSPSAGKAKSYQIIYCWSIDLIASPLHSH